MRKLFPEALFLHIHRNPYDVFRSTRNLYRKLLPAFSLQRGDWETDWAAEADRLILDSYPRMMDALERDVADLPPERYLDLRYEAFDGQELPHMERIYGQLNLGDFAVDRPHFERYLASIEGYQKNQFTMSPADQKRVNDQWGQRIEKLGYEVLGG